ncbi:hypothetical protein B0J13DRAFT_547898 [Dactylonectria estremocensis]|uniref:Secreted protein n=1 Tax=Dactylonectria estremocensis TaxID=1079267 RepID=A0A9P9J7E8_9HYPO|nr:hypothetical protein B0J13DRAFT_547898 [Dactylonectria estremocensis]
MCACIGFCVYVCCISPSARVCVRVQMLMLRVVILDLCVRSTESLAEVGDGGGGKTVDAEGQNPVKPTKLVSVLQLRGPSYGVWGCLKADWAVMGAGGRQKPTNSC